MAERPKFYVVWKGRKTGVFSSWAACAAQVQGFTGARYRSYTSRPLAEQAFRGKYATHVGRPVSSGDWLFAPNPPIAPSLVVDAACSGSPGMLEYRGVDLDSGKEIFRQGPYKKGTNNVGEFLAIVHALSMLARPAGVLSRPGAGDRTPVYSDSKTAIAWVKAKHCNTELVADKTNAPLFALIDLAEDWLANHKVVNPVLKWDTRAWGENPADFNRK